MLQMKRKTNKTVLSALLCAALFIAMAAFFAVPTANTAHAATTVIESLSLANINAGNATGKYGNFSWDNTKLKSVSASEMTTDRNNDPFCIVWTRPANGTYASALSFSVTITDSVGAITIRYDDDTVPTYVQPGEKQSGTLTETVNTFYSTYEKIYFYVSRSYMYNDVNLTAVSIQLKSTTYKMTFTKGTGIKDAYLSTDSNAKSGNGSGSEFAKFSTVYCFAKLNKGYKAQNSWTLIDGTANSEDAIYRVGTCSNVSAANNFGTINATAKQKYLIRNLNGGGSMSGINLIYNQVADLTVPSRTGYTFSGWNTNAAGTGTAYGNGNSATLTAEQVNAIIEDGNITTLYAQWEANDYSVIVDGNSQNLTYGSAFHIEPATPEEGYEFAGYFDGENGTGTKYTDANGDSIRSWDKTENDTNLYAYFTKDMTIASVVGYDADYDGDAHGIIVNVTDPENDYTITYGETEGSYNMESITKTDAGTYTIYFKISKTGYNDYCSSAVIKINKIDAVLTAPTAKIGLKYVGETQELVTAGSTTGGTLQYKLGDGEWTTVVPSATDVANYTVSYRVVGDVNYNDVAAVTIENIAIAQVDKSTLSDLIAVVNGYYDEIVGDYSDIAAMLEGRKQQISNDYFVEQNVTEAQVAAAVNTLQGYLDDAKSDVVKAKIDAIGNVEYTETCKAKIDAARAGYNALTVEQRKLVDNNDALTAAEAAYKALDDNAKANAVKDLIDAIGDVKYTETCKAKIDAARAGYNALTEEQRELVDNNDALTAAEAAYKALDDQAKANAAKALIGAIGEVKYPDSKETIEAARAGYDALTETQKALVDNYETLTTAETTYAELEAKANKKLSGGAVAGIVIGCIFGLFIICFIILFLLYKRDQGKEDDKKLIKVPFINDVMGKVDALLFKNKA